MRVFLILMGLVALAAGGGVFYFRAHPEANPVALWFHDPRSSVRAIVEQAQLPAKASASGKDAAKGAVDVAPPPPPVNQVTLG